jgi:hypothetical protein
MATIQWPDNGTTCYGVVIHYPISEAEAARRGPNLYPSDCHDHSGPYASEAQAKAVARRVTRGLEEPAYAAVVCRPHAGTMYQVDPAPGR